MAGLNRGFQCPVGASFNIVGGGWGYFLRGQPCGWVLNFFSSTITRDVWMIFIMRIHIRKRRSLYWNADAFGLCSYIESYYLNTAVLHLRKTAYGLYSSGCMHICLAVQGPFSIYGWARSQQMRPRVCCFFFHWLRACTVVERIRASVWRGVLSQFSPFRYFPNFSELSKHWLSI